MSSTDGFRGSVRLFYGVLKKEYLLLLRYKWNTLTGLAVTYALFLLILVGGRTLGGSGFDDSLGAVVIGFTFWVMSAAAYASLATQMTDEASWGTLEQLYVAPLGFRRVILMMSVTGIVDAIVRNSVLFVGVFLTAGISFHFDPLVLPVLVFGLLSILGVGLAFGAIAIRFKRVDEIVGVLSLGFTGLIAAPIDEYPALQYLPLAKASALLRGLMSDPSFALRPLDVVVLVGVGVGYFVAGYGALVFFIRSARKNGVMGHY